MKRWWNAVGLCIGISATGISSGEEVEWRAVGSAPKSPTTETVQQANHTDPPAPVPDVPKLITPFPTTTTTPQPPAEAVPPPQPPTNAVPALVGPVAPPTAVDCGPVVLSETYVSDVTRFFVRAEFLAWWTKSIGGPPLLTTTTAAFPARGANGQTFPDANGNVPISALGNIGSLGAPGTVTLLTSKDLDNDFRPGFRFAFGWSIDPCGMRGIDGSIFYTGRQSQTYSASNAQFPTLFRPFFAADPRIDLGNQPGQFREIVAATSLGINGIFAAEHSSEFWGADINYRRCLWRGCYANADVFAGFRYLSLDEDLNIFENITATRTLHFLDNTGAVVSTLPAGSRFVVADRFSTSNDFYGGQIGVDATFQRDRWSLNVRPSVALGVTHQQVCIEGASTATVPGQAPQQLVGGLYALNSNIGCYTKNPFTVVPELQLRVGYQLTDRLKVTLGYDFLYWSDVVRPADQIDFVLDTNRLPPPQTPTVNPPRPGVPFHSTDFWAMGINTGLEYRW